jgi:hypothetical protein
MKLRELFESNVESDHFQPDTGFLKTKEEIAAWLDEHKVTNYSINDDLAVDVNGDVSVHVPKHIPGDPNAKWANLPIQFGKVSGKFYIQNVKDSLKGCPKEVGGTFTVFNSYMPDLIGSPSKVGQHFYLSNCHRLESLTGMASSIGGYVHIFGCHRLKNLEGMPDTIHGDLIIRQAQSLQSLQGSAKRIEGRLDIVDASSLFSIKGCPNYIDGNFNLYRTSVSSIVGIASTINGEFAFSGGKGLHQDAHILMMIKGLQAVKREVVPSSKSGKALAIINKYLKQPYGMKRWIDCQSELIDTGYENYAKVRSK